MLSVHVLLCAPKQYHDEKAVRGPSTKQYHDEKAVRDLHL